MLDLHTSRRFPFFDKNKYTHDGDGLAAMNFLAVKSSSTPLSCSKAGEENKAA